MSNRWLNQGLGTGIAQPVLLAAKVVVTGSTGLVTAGTGALLTSASNPNAGIGSVVKLQFSEKFARLLSFDVATRASGTLAAQHPAGRWVLSDDLIAASGSVFLTHYGQTVGTAGGGTVLALTGTVGAPTADQTLYVTLLASDSPSDS